MRALFASLAIFVMTFPAIAQGLCDTERAMLDILLRNHNEFPVFRAEVGSMQRLILTRSDSGTWTLLISSGDKFCVGAAGSTSRFDKGV